MKNKAADAADAADAKIHTLGWGGGADGGNGPIERANGPIQKHQKNASHAAANGGVKRPLSAAQRQMCQAIAVECWDAKGNDEAWAIMEARLAQFPDDVQESARTCIYSLMGKMG